MTRALTVILLCTLSSVTARAQRTTFQDTLLDQMTGSWVLHGTIDGVETTHDVEAEWVLAHQYMRIHEISQETDDTGAPVYEAIVFIGWDEAQQEYQCLWLDVTGGGGLNGQAIGHAKRETDRIGVLFKLSEGNLFHTIFVYDRPSHSWEWLMDSEVNGKVQPFARLVMERDRL